MTKSLIKNTFREIKNTKARFISIMAIIALGVGFFAGIKATVPSMYNLARTYTDEQELMDYRLVSTVGFDEDDIKAVKNTDGVTSVMPSYFCDVQTDADSGGRTMRVIALPEKYGDNSVQNKLVLTEGRLPEKSGEIAADSTSFTAEGYKIGDKIRFAKQTGDTDTSTELKTLEYTVVGLVQSPLYIAYQRGTTTVGNGKISDYFYICPEDFAFERYTELYVKTDISDKFLAYTDDYDNAIEDKATDFEKVGEDRSNSFTVEVIDKAKSDLADAKQEYSDNKEKTEKKLADAKTAIDDGKKELKTKTDDAQKKLDSAKQQIEDGKTQLENSRNEYNTKIADAQAQIAEKESQLNSAEKQYNSSKAEFDKEISKSQAEIENAEYQLQSAKDTFQTEQEPQLLAGISQAEDAVSALQYQISQTTDEETLAVLNAQLEQAQQTLDELNATYDSAKAQLEESESRLSESKALFEQKKSEGQAQLDYAYSQISSGRTQLDAAKAELAQQSADGQAQLDSAESKLNDAQSEYDSGVAKLAEEKKNGEKKLSDAQTEYDDGVKKADEEFKKAEDKIKDAEEEINSLTEPKWYVFDRSDNPGYSTFSSNADRLGAVATVFPVFFLLVAVLVCVTTMTRLIEEKRTEIGTLKALGYSNTSIVMKFVIYSLLAAVIGSVIGILIGIFTLPFVIYDAYKIMYYIGDITLIPDYTSIIFGIVAAVVCTVVVSVVVCAKSLHEKPAAVMRPKAPKAGKRILLERIKPLWSHMSFNSKLTARNLFRYKVRLCMTVIGVAGCTALIVAAFGLLNSFEPMTHDQFETIYKYDAVVVPKDSGSADNLSFLTDTLDKNSNVKHSMLVSQQECTVTHGNKIKDSDTNLVVPQNPEKFDEIVSLHTRKGKEELKLSDSGVMLSEKMCSELGIKTGDKITLNVDGKKAEVKVSGIFEQYLYNFVYMTPTAYKSLFGSDCTYNMADVALKDTSDSACDKFGSQVLSDDKIAAVSYIASSLNEFKNMLNSLDMVVTVMIICAAALAFVVLYNLTNINIAERVREIATFKVLGFYNRETSSFIYKENIILTLLGIFVGLFLGNLLTGFIIQTVEVDNIMFGRDIYFTSYLYAAGLTFLFSILVNAVMSFKIKAVNMVESLKSVE